MSESTSPAVEAVALSAAALRETRVGRGEPELAAIARLARPQLYRSIQMDEQKLAFWINVYNAGIQRELRQNPRAYRFRWWFFACSGVTVAGRHLSFNAIEHGLLRRSMFAYSLGYLANPLPGNFERHFRLAKRDPRVHFALNCGAASCPPIATYDDARIDAQLDLAASAYLRAECRYDPASNRVEVPRLLLWFRGDFGGPEGILHMLKRSNIIPAGASPGLRYRTYDWSLKLD